MNRKRVFMPKMGYIHHKNNILNSWSFEFLAINTICYMKYTYDCILYNWDVKKYEMVQFNFNVLCMHI